jgi:transcriptional regulator with XRE-family HTH domain
VTALTHETAKNLPPLSGDGAAYDRELWSKLNPVDVHVGNRVRLRRMLLGLSQQRVGEALSLTFQQVQRYEHGANRIGASRLWELSGVLECPVSFFFDEMDKKTASFLPPPVSNEESGSKGDGDELLNCRETLELVRAYYRIDGVHVRRRIYELTKALATTKGETADEGAPPQVS